MKYLEIIFCTLLLILIISCSKSKYDYLNQESQIITRSITEHQTPFIIRLLIGKIQHQYQ